MKPSRIVWKGYATVGCSMMLVGLVVGILEADKIPVRVSNEEMFQNCTGLTHLGETREQTVSVPIQDATSQTLTQVDRVQTQQITYAMATVGCVPMNAAEANDYLQRKKTESEAQRVCMAMVGLGTLGMLINLQAFRRLMLRYDLLCAKIHPLNSSPPTIPEPHGASAPRLPATSSPSADELPEESSPQTSEAPSEEGLPSFVDQRPQSRQALPPSPSAPLHDGISFPSQEGIDQIVTVQDVQGIHTDQISTAES